MYVPITRLAQRVDPIIDQQQRSDVEQQCDPEQRQPDVRKHGIVNFSEEYARHGREPYGAGRWKQQVKAGAKA